MKRTIALTSLALLSLPTFAFAALGGVKEFLVDIGDLIDMATIIVAGLALLMFFYGLLRFIYAGAQGKIDGKNFMIWGIVALFVMVSVWGLVRFIQDQILPGEDFSNPPTVPSFGNPL